MKKIVIILLFLFSFNLYSQTQDTILSNYFQTQDTILPRFNINGELLGITRIVGGVNLEYNFLNLDINKSLLLSSGIYLCVGGFANVSNINFSYGTKYCLETSLNLISQLSDLSDNKREYCWYGTNKYRFGSSIGLRYKDKANKVFYKVHITCQLVNTECISFDSSTFEKSTTFNSNVPLFSVGFIYGLYF